jgi:hypothetical protein
MMIHLGESQILKRQVTHPVHRGVDVDCSGAHLFQQLAEMILIHALRE